MVFTARSRDLNEKHRFQNGVNYALAAPRRQPAHAGGIAMRLRGSVIEQIVVGMLVVIATAGCSLVVETVSYRPRQDVTAPDGPVVDGEETEGGIAVMKESMPRLT